MPLTETGLRLHKLLNDISLVTQKHDGKPIQPFTFTDMEAEVDALIWKAGCDQRELEWLKLERCQVKPKARTSLTIGSRFLQGQYEVELTFSNRLQETFKALLAGEAPEKTN